MFNLFRRSAKTEQPVQLTAQDAVGETRSLGIDLLDIFGAAPVSSGVSVSPNSAMRCAPVRACVEAIAEAVGGLPLHLYEKSEDGARNRASDHPVYRLLHDEVTESISASQFREQLTRDALLWGNGVALINRVNGEPRELNRLRPDAVSIELHPATGEPFYRYNEGSGQRTFPWRDVIHIAAPSLDGVKGESPVRQCREAIGLALAIEAHTSRLFGNGGRPGGVLSIPPNTPAERTKKIKAIWQATFGGGKSGGTALLEDGAEFKPVQLNSVDSQTLELWQHAVIEICRVFRVPPHLVFDLGRATWGNAGEMGATFLRFTLDRWLKAWQGEIRLKLLTPEERQTHYAEFLVDDLLRSDLAARAEAYSKLIAARVLNPNEVRAMENRAPYAGGDVFANPNVTTTTTKTEPAK